MEDSRWEAVRRTAAGLGISLVGIVLLAVPLYDIWDDVADLNWSLTMTLVENSVLLAMSLALVVGGLWIAQSDWDPRHAATVATWTGAGLVVATSLFTWVILTQWWAMHGLKPYVIALDGIVIGSAATFAAGIYKARMDARTEALTTERERFSGLFQNTTDAIAALRFAEGQRIDADVNRTFEETFGHDLDEVLSRVVAEIPDVDGQEALVDRAHDGEGFEMEFDYEVDGDRRDYLVRLLPYTADSDRSYLYVVVTDITDQTRLVRERAANDRMTTLHGIAGDLEAVETFDELHELTMDAVDRTVEAVGAQLVLDDETVAEETFSDDEPGADESDLEVLTASVGDRGRLDVWGDGFEEYERTSVELLTTHLSRTLARLDREEALRDERDQLEFVNRTLRHNLLNDLQVARAHLDLIEPADEQDAHHHEVVADHVEDMAGFVDTMRTYMSQLVDREEHELEPRSLRETVLEVTTKAENAHEGATVTVEDLPDVSVRADDLLGPLFENLVTNAIQHHDRAEQHVRVSGELGEGTVTVSVADDGPGISDDLRDAVFDRGELGVDSAGSGFGLYLVDQAVDAYDGEIEIEDNEPRGTIFRVTLPLAEDARVIENASESESGE